MKQIFTLWMLILLFGLKGMAQVSSYSFTQSSNTYASITGTTAHASGWDDAVTTATIPFTYTFNGIGYTSCSINSNGYLTFGATVSSTTGYTALSATTGYAGAVAAFSRDLISNASIVVYTTTGTSPNRIFIVQWNNARRYSGGAITGDVLNFQIRLYETSNKAEIMYGTCTATSTTALTSEVGLRGASNTDFNNRTTSTNWSSTTSGAAGATCISSNTIMPASGLTFTWVLPTCTSPIMGVPGSITTSSASVPFTCTSCSPGNAYIIEYGLAGFTPGTGAAAGTGGTVVTGTASPIAISSLSANTTYDVYVRQNCTASANGYSANSTKATFKTLCTATGFPFTEAFTSTTFPPTSCWSVSNATYIFRSTSNGYGATGTGSAEFNFFLAGAGNYDLTLPVLTATPANYTLSFDEAYAAYSSSFIDNLSILYSTNNGSTYTTLTTYTGSVTAGTGLATAAATTSSFTPTATQWATKSIVLPAGTTNIIFRGVSNNGNNLYIDNINIAAPPTCTSPIMGVPGSITTSSASVPFTCTSCSPGNAYIIEYGLAGFTPGTGAAAGTGGTVVTGTASPIAISSLSANTTYDVYVRQNCTASANGYSANSTKATFKTLCGTVTVPYTQNFDGVTAPAIPGCTSVQDINADGFTWATSAGASSTAPNSLRYAYNSTTTTVAANDWWFTPGINLTNGITYQVTFVYKAESASFPEALELKTGTSASAAGMTGAALFSNTSITNTGFVTATITYTATATGVQYFGWHAISAADEYNLYIDNISITALAPCSGTPTGGTVTVTPPSDAPGAAYTVTATGYTTGSGLTYQWQSSSNGGSTWGNVGTATTGYTALNQTAGTFGTVTTYRLVVTCTSSGGLANSTTATFTSAYCTPTHTNAITQNIITRVDFVGTLNDVSNTSPGSNTIAYEDFTGLTNKSVQEQGGAINLNVYGNTASSLWNAWVDWNQDGIFSSSEQVYNSNGTLTLTTTFGFQVPATQAIGNYRVRIRTADYNTGFGSNDGYTNASIGSCGNLLDGQAEDYLFTVVAHCTAQVVSVANDTKCSSSATSFALFATGTTGTTGFNWYTAQTGGTLAATTAASGAPPVSTFTTPLLSTTTTYWVTATNGSCESLARLPVVADKRPVPTISFTPASPARICDGDGLSVGGTSSTETANLINEGFESGSLGEFTVTNKGTLTDATNQPWKVRTSIFTPTMSSVWRPAVSSGSGANKFVFALSDIANSGIYRTSLTSAGHNTTGFTNLNLSFKLYFDHYLPDGTNTILDTVTVFASPDGTTWNLIQTYITDQGTASNMPTYNFNLGSAYLGQANVKVRFTYSANWTNGVALDSIRLYGDRPASNSYVWTQVGGLVDNCLFTDAAFTMPYTGGPTAQVYLNPTAAQTDDGTPLAFETQLAVSNGCTAKDTIVVNIDDKIWQGTNSNSWYTAGNWCGNKVPNLADRVSIPYLPGGNYPVIQLNATPAKSRFLTIDSGAVIIIDSGAALQIRRDLYTFPGATFANNGSLTMLGTEKNENQHFPGPGTIPVMNNLTINYTANPPGDTGVVLNALVSIKGELRPTAGLLALANNSITIKSSAAGTGFISAVGSSAGFAYFGTGRFNIERFIPARRAWRFLSVPFDSAQTTATVNAAWQDGKTNPDLNCANNQYVVPGFGTQITYNGTNGYDPNITYNTSLKAWVNNAWATPSGTNIKMNTYPAYCLFVRGDRTICLSAGTNAVANNTVLRASGILNEPGVSSLNFSKTYFGNPGAFIFIGNPYASSIDLANVLKPARSTGIDNNKFWTWDPRANGAFGVGGYVTFSNGVQVPYSANPGDTDLLYNGGTIIQSGQAFMVQLGSTSSAASMAFQQVDKTSAQQTNIFGRQQGVKDGTAGAVIYTNLLIPEGSTKSLTDGVGAAFGNRFSAKVDAEDAAKQWNFDENIALVRGASTLAIEFRPVPTLADTLFYRLYLRQQPYTLQVFSQNLPGNNMPAKAWLVDSYLKTKTEINLYDTTLYNFTPNTDTMSYRNRFMLVFSRQLSTTPVPVSKVTNQSDPNTTGNGITIAAAGGTVSITPNPVTAAKNAMLRFSNMAKGNYEVVIYDGKGQKLATKHIQHDGSNTIYHLPSGASWSAGVYLITVLNKNTTQTFSEKLVISK